MITARPMRSIAIPFVVAWMCFAALLPQAASAQTEGADRVDIDDIEPQSAKAICRGVNRYLRLVENGGPTDEKAFRELVRLSREVDYVSMRLQETGAPPESARMFKAEHAAKLKQIESTAVSASGALRDVGLSWQPWFSGPPDCRDDGDSITMAYWFDDLPVRISAKYAKAGEHYVLTGLLQVGLQALLSKKSNGK